MDSVLVVVYPIYLQQVIQLLLELIFSSPGADVFPPHICSSRVQYSAGKIFLDRVHSLIVTAIWTYFMDIPRPIALVTYHLLPVDPWGKNLLGCSLPGSHCLFLVNVLDIVHQRLGPSEGWAERR